MPPGPRPLATGIESPRGSRFSRSNGAVRWHSARPVRNRLRRRRRRYGRGLSRARHATRTRGRDQGVVADLTSSQLARERFQREARTIAALHHPHICAIYDVGETPEHQAFIVMEFLQGETLEERLRKGRLDLPIVLETAIALADALAAAHAAGIVHRDIKPANVFLTAWGPKLLDFGVAKTAPRVAAANSVTQTDAARPMLTAEGAAVGTLAYMSPEQLRGDEVDARTDVFSLGLVLFQMATGRPAFAGATGAGRRGRNPSSRSHRRPRRCVPS